MKNYFSKNPYHQRKKIIQNNQFGFHSNHSTIHQIHKITDNISSSFEKEEHCLAVFFFYVAHASVCIWYQQQNAI